MTFHLIVAVPSCPSFCWQFGSCHCDQTKASVSCMKACSKKLKVATKNAGWAGRPAGLFFFRLFFCSCQYWGLVIDAAELSKEIRPSVFNCWTLSAATDPRDKYNSHFFISSSKGNSSNCMFHKVPSAPSVLKLVLIKAQNWGIPLKCCIRLQQ